MILFKRLSGILRRSTDFICPFVPAMSRGDELFMSRLSLCLRSLIFYAHPHPDTPLLILLCINRYLYTHHSPEIVEFFVFI